MSEKKVLLELRGVKTFFPVRGGFFNKVRDHVQAVNDVDLDIYKGETLGLVGESGCGKSVTSLSLMQLLQRPQGQIVDGQIRLNLGDKAYDIAKTPMEKMVVTYGLAMFMEANAVSPS